MAHNGNCLECGSSFTAKRACRVFCCTAHRQKFNNRRMQRGAELYDLFMAQRFQRDAAKNAGVWNFMCRMAASHKAEDDAERAGRQSWDAIPAVMSRNAHIDAIIINSNAAGGRPHSVTVK